MGRAVRPRDHRGVVVGHAGARHTTRRPSGAHHTRGGSVVQHDGRDDRGGGIDPYPRPWRLPRPGRALFHARRDGRRLLTYVPRAPHIGRTAPGPPYRRVTV